MFIAVLATIFTPKFIGFQEFNLLKDRKLFKRIENYQDIRFLNMRDKLIIALDGPSAAGKGLIGSMIAKEFSLTYFQSSLVYRGLAYICLKNKIDLTDEAQIIRASDTDIFKHIEGVDLNNEEIGAAASIISAIPSVREELGIYLKEIIRNNSKIIMEGRDIGTVVAPNADLKLFVTANVEVRAQRRYKQLCAEGKECILDEILNLLKVRDERDRSRLTAPLVPARDAYIIDTSDLTPEEVIQKIRILINKSL